MSYPPPPPSQPPPGFHNGDRYDARYDERYDRRRRAEDSSYEASKRRRYDDRRVEEHRADAYERPYERPYERDGRDRDRYADRQRRQSDSPSPPRSRYSDYRYQQPPAPHRPPQQPLPHNPHLPYHQPYPYPPPLQPPPPASYAQQSSAPPGGVLRIGFPTRQPNPPLIQPQHQPTNPPLPKLSLPLPPPPPAPATPTAAYRNPAITAAPHSPPRCAYVWLVMKGDAYIPGALVSAYSLSLTGTPHALLCMVTGDVSEAGRRQLGLVFDRVVEVEYIVAQAKPLRTAKQQALYSSWSDRSFTKWQCLTLTDYDRVLFIDADKLILASLDHLFLLRAPAATFSSPWSTVYLTAAQKQKRGAGLDNPYAQLQHGDRVPYDAIERGLHTNSFVCIGTMVLLQPSMQHHAEFLRLLEPFQQSERLQAPASFGYEKCHSMLDEQSLTLLYHQRLSIPFTYIHQRYNYLCWHRAWLSSTDLPAVFHYFSTKPWAMPRRQWLDVEVWWRMAEAMLRSGGGRGGAVQGEGGQGSGTGSDELRRALGDGKQLEEERLQGCAWCKECKRDDWELHSLFDDDGKMECPEMRKRQPRDGAEKLQQKGRAADTEAETTVPVAPATQ